MLPQRKQTRLAGFDYSQPGAYSITVCVDHRRCLLGSIVGADAHIGPQVRLSSAGRIAEKYLRTIPGIDQYVVMPNHVHMILRISARDLREGPVWEDAPVRTSVAKLVRFWKTLVSKELGGSIWQRSYYDHVIRSEQDYVAISQYILENPAKWQEDTLYAE